MLRKMAAESSRQTLPVEMSWELDAELGFPVSSAFPGTGWTRATSSKSLAKVTPRAVSAPEPTSGVKSSASTAELQDQVRPATSLSLSFPTCKMGQGRPPSTATETSVPGHSPVSPLALMWLKAARSLLRVYSPAHLRKVWLSCSLRGPRQQATHRKCSEQCATRINTHEILARGGTHTHRSGWTVPSIPDNVWPELCRPDTLPGPRGGESLGEDEGHGDTGSEKTPRPFSLQL